MKKRIGVLLLSMFLLLSLSGIATAADDTKGIYVGVIGGYVIPLVMGTSGTTAGFI